MANEQVPGGQVLACKLCKPDDSGCSRCGGSKVVLERHETTCCEQEYWIRPMRGVTVYDGKYFDSFDGLVLVWRKNGLMCKPCDDGEAE